MVATAQDIPPVDLKIAKRPSRVYTLQAYMQREANSKDKHEFINGQIIKIPYAKGPHNIISANMITQMNIAFFKAEKDYTVFSSDQQIYFPLLDDGVYADAVAVCDTPQYWDSNELLLINPIVVVEVLSKSTQRYDRNGKFDMYKTLDSLREYVLVRQDKCYAEVWFRERKGLWHESIIEDPNGTLTLQSVGIQLNMQDIYRKITFKDLKK
jgi:Uma2 family endonuclease